MSYDIIIIGGGITGLYLSYLLNSTKSFKKRILLLEKDDRFGGRIRTHHTVWNHKKYTFEEGASRFNQYHKKLLHLIKELKLEKYIHPISSHSKYYPNESLSSDNADNTEINTITKTNKRIESNILNVIRHMKKESKDILQKTVFEEYALQLITKDEIKEVMDSTGYYAEYKRMNAYDFLRLYKKWINPNIQYYGLYGGLSTIIDRLEEEIKDKVDILKGNYGHVIQIEKIRDNKKIIGYYVHTEKRIYKTRCCILALPKNALLQLSILKSIKKELNSIYETPLCRIYSFYSSKNIWWKNIKTKITTQTPIRMIIPIQDNLIMSSYSDDIFADKWNKINDKETTDPKKNQLNKYITKYTRDIFGNDCNDCHHRNHRNHIQEPEDSKIFYWKYGVGCWKKGVDSISVYHKIIEPFSKTEERFYICGENYSFNQGWIEGALEMADDVYKRLKTNFSFSILQKN